MKTIYFTRHGQSEANLDRVYAGWLDSPLTDLGREQAQRVRDAVKTSGVEVDVIISSTLSRARETAVIIAEGIDFPLEAIEYDERLKERGYGVFAGEEKSEESNRVLQEHSKIDDNQYEVEWIGDVIARLESFRADLWVRPEKTILLIGHNSSGGILKRLYAGVDYDAPLPDLENASVIQLHPEVRSEVTL